MGLEFEEDLEMGDLHGIILNISFLGIEIIKILLQHYINDNISNEY